MTTGTIKTQGTRLYFVDPTTPPGTILKMACPTGITGLGGAADQIEDTCLDALTEKTYQKGLNNPGPVSVPFNFIPREVSQQKLFTLKDAGTVLKWLECFSESQTAPTIIDSDGEPVAPTDCTTIGFDGYISDLNIDVATNEIVRGTLTIQRSGALRPVFYTPA